MNLEEQTKCTECEESLHRCIIHPCRDLVYDNNDPFIYAHLCGICILCKKIKRIYFSNDPRVYFPPSPIKDLCRLEDKYLKGPISFSQIL